MDKNNKLFILSILLIAAAALSRLVPHPANCTPVTAVALFSAVYFSDKRLSFALPLASLFLSDMLLLAVNGTSLGAINIVVYASIAAIVGIGFLLKKHFGILPLAASAIGGSILFFIITNFAVWAGWNMYPKTVEGLIQCYAAAIPFFRNALLGDIGYTAVLFGLHYLAETIIIKSPEKSAV